MNGFPVLTFITLVPLLGGILLAGLNPHSRIGARRLALLLALVELALITGLWLKFQPALDGFQFEEQHVWISAAAGTQDTGGSKAFWTAPLAVGYHLGVDGVSLLMLLLTGLVVPMGMLASRAIQERTPLYYALVLFLQAGLVGTFTALNFVHWFLYWELSLIPAFFLIRLWGGPGRGVASTRFLVYTLVGSVAMLLAFLAIFLATGRFDFVELAEMGRNGTLAGALSAKLGWYDLTTKRLVLVIFGGVLLGIAVKVPMIPFHTWLPDAYAEAPTGTTMLLTGLMSKMGVYACLRILLPIFPGEMRSVATPLLWLAVVTIVFSAGAALAQKDLKRMLAYSSVNHLGYCLLGVFAVLNTGANAHSPLVEKAAALNGVALQMFNHGLTAATLFWLAGILEERSGGLRSVADFGGLRRVAPVLCGLMGIALFASLGLPGLNGFVGEFLIFKGVFSLAPWAAALSVAGLLLTAVLLLTLSQRVFHGPLNERWQHFADLTLRERAQLAVPLALMLVLGVYPQAVLRVLNRTVTDMVQHLRF
jgi:NADH-quinone oxidoreductase subunit M